MDTQIIQILAETDAQNFVETVANFLPFPWNCVVSGLGGAVIALFCWRKQKKNAENE